MLAVMVTPVAAAMSIAGRAAGSDVVGTPGIAWILPCLIVLAMIALFMPRPFLPIALAHWAIRKPLEDENDQ